MGGKSHCHFVRLYWQSMAGARFNGDIFKSDPYFSSTMQDLMGTIPLI